MTARRIALALSLAVVVGMTTACQPEPAPSPSTPVFASEAEAFAAAEETYRAYVDALNQVDLSDPSTFEAVYAWTTGDANAGEKKSLTKMHADGWTVHGDTLVTAVAPVAFTAGGSPAVVQNICADVSGVQVVDEAGRSMVAADRPSMQASIVSFLESPSSPTRLLIDTIEGGNHSC